MSKRRRTNTGFSRVKRPIDKSLVSIVLDDVNATQQQVILDTASSACTVVGIRWDLLIEGDAGTVGLDHDYSAAIVMVRDGNSANAFGLANGSSWYEPEQNVLAFHRSTSHASVTATTGITPANWEGTTKSMRKLMTGDAILFIIEGIATNTVRVRGVIQLFCKF